MDIKDCAAVVTGGASGLGEACARKLAAKGAKVTIFDLNAERGELVAKDINGVFAQVNVTEEDSVNQGLDTASAAYGEARILVNCAGIAIGQKTTSKGAAHVLADFERVIKINLIGSFNCIRLTATRMAALELINAEERGVIVSTASVAAYDGQVGQAAYAASKGGIVGMTLPIARDLSRDAIRVMTIAPGIFQTPLMDNLPQEVQDSLAVSVPNPARLGDPAEFAALVQHICENAYLNGETIRLDGSIRMAPK
ncbi:MAG: 3-hydroxyacyl-CoA dehydrogenase [Gammaproteobacteria bacterium]|jgi:NAD(P)-dependent dehydrogenase (short-subunit alcohol dehydrogenase family)|nr:3-hydroxyacyl-CoA dehydrogenase [Gammaproteobacteria bacterium]